MTIRISQCTDQDIPCLLHERCGGNSEPRSRSLRACCCAPHGPHPRHHHAPTPYDPVRDTPWNGGAPTRGGGRTHSIHRYTPSHPESSSAPRTSPGSADPHAPRPPSAPRPIGGPRSRPLGGDRSPWSHDPSACWHAAGVDPPGRDAGCPFLRHSDTSHPLPLPCPSAVFDPNQIALVIDTYASISGDVFGYNPTPERVEPWAHLGRNHE